MGFTVTLSLGAPRSPSLRCNARLSSLQLGWMPFVPEPRSSPISKRNENTCSQWFSLNQELLVDCGSSPPFKILFILIALA